MILDDYLKRIVEQVSIITPAIFGSIFGWLGFTLSKKEAGLTIGQVIGGILLSGFTGASSSIMFHHLGFDYTMSSMLASMIGASGLRGYEWLTSKVLKLLERSGG